MAQGYWTSLASDTEKAVASLGQLIGLLTTTHRDLSKLLPEMQHAASLAKEHCPDAFQVTFRTRIQYIDQTAKKMKFQLEQEGREEVLRIPIVLEALHNG